MARRNAPHPDPAADPVEELRRICLSLPEVTERISHGEPTWFIRAKKSVVMLDDHHHGADHLAFWCPAPPGVQAELVDQEPERFFKPPYVGPKGWLGVRIDRHPDWAEITEIVRDAYLLVAPKKLAALLDPDLDPDPDGEAEPEP